MIEEVRPADIILYEATPLDSFITRAVGAAQLLLGIGRTSITYSHVAIAAWTRGFQHESKFPFSGRFPVDESRRYEVWRLRGIDDDKRKIILRDCQMHSGELYPLDTLLTAGLIVHRRMKVCSQWAAARCFRAGYDFKKEGLRIVAPDVMRDSGILHYIGEGGKLK